MARNGKKTLVLLFLTLLKLFNFFLLLNSVVTVSGEQCGSGHTGLFIKLRSKHTADECIIHFTVECVNPLLFFFPPSDDFFFPIASLLKNMETHTRFPTQTF